MAARLLAVCVLHASAPLQEIGEYHKFIELAYVSCLPIGSDGWTLELGTPMTEQDIENALIDQLKGLGYTYRPDIRDRDSLTGNFREHFEKLNLVQLSDAEFERLLNDLITPDVYAASQWLRNTNSFEREDGTPLNYTLVNTRDWCKNHFELIHQLRMNTANSHHRYDVILLLNGVPIVQIELKNVGVSPRRAMEQIEEYKEDAGNGYGNSLLCFLQLFIVSNREHTWYFANNNPGHFRFNVDERFLPVYHFADAENHRIERLEDFAGRFLTKCPLAETVSKYMVLVASEQKLLVMRPYQVHAVKAIMECIRENSGNGYIWHTTGSGKTLTSFKASTLMKDDPSIYKCLFVVDRKDLDRQTREEFNRFQVGCVEANTNTSTLVERLLSEDHANKVIVTTIQKLGLALDESARERYRNRLAPLRDKRFVFIFDECHRSQFGENHRAIKEFFPNSQLFGFTGTPIFTDNAQYIQVEGQKARFRTTEDLFGRCLHRYTITHAIDDGNVLRFHVDYFRWEGDETPQPGTPPYRETIVRTILGKHDAATANRRFNALFATQSIPDAIAYYVEFQRIQEELQDKNENYRPLNIACVFSPPANGDRDLQQIQEELPQEQEDNRQDPAGKKTALSSIVADYNDRYGTNHILVDFDSYYQDVQSRIKSHEWSNQDVPPGKKIDITIVVDMLLTGFDSKYLNTLYVDKTLRYHGLIQAFSRTNRVLNDSKPNGNILDFRSQKDTVDEAITLFSGETDRRAQEIWLVEPAPKVIERLADAGRKLFAVLEVHDLPPTPAAVDNLKGESAKVLFMQKFKDVQKLMTQLRQYTDMSKSENDRVEDLMPKERYEGFRARYLEMARGFRSEQETRNASPEVENLEFDLVLFTSNLIDYDYIMKLIARMTEEKPANQFITRERLIEIIQGDAKFIDEREDIAAYIRNLPTGKRMSETDIEEGYERFKQEREQQALVDIANQHGVDLSALIALVEDTLRRRVFDGDTLRELFQTMDLGWKVRTQKETALMQDLIPFLRKMAKGGEISGLNAYERL